VFLHGAFLFYPAAAHVSPYAACCSAIFFKPLTPARAGRSFFRRRKAGGPPATRLSDNAAVFAVRPPARRKKNRVQFKKRLRLGEASGIRRDTDGDDQKKAYEKQIIS